MQHPLRSRIEPANIRRKQMGRPLKIAKAQAVITVTNTTATTNVVTTSASLSALGIIKGMPIIFASAIGGLAANTTYWILNIVSDTTFTVSASILNANPTSTPVTLSTASGTVLATIAPVNAYFNNPEGPQWPATNANTYGVVGGNTAIIGNQVVGTLNLRTAGVGTIVAENDSTAITGTGTEFVAGDVGKILYTDAGVVIGTIATVTNSTTVALAADATVNYTGTFELGTSEDAYIMRQKGKQKYLVRGTTTGTVAAVFTVDASLTPQPANTIVISAVNSANATGSIQTLSNKNSKLFTPDSGPIATGNINLRAATSVQATFNSAVAANTQAGINFPIVTVNRA
jgi:hypothetical protein